MLDAVKQGLSTHGPGAPREIEISREDLFEAVRAGLDHSGISPEQVWNRLHELVDAMRSEFKSYSAANGRDTEQVLDAMKDGLESLRAEIESYVDRAQDVTGKDEIIDTVRDGLNHLRSDVEGFVAAGPQGEQSLSRVEMLAYIKSEFEHLHESVNEQIVPNSDGTAHRDAILGALHAGFESVRSSTGSRGLDDDEMQEAMKEEFEQLLEKMLAGTNVHKDEILSTIQGGFDDLAAKLEGTGSSDQTVSGVKEELEHLRETLATTLIRSGSGGGADAEELTEAVKDSLAALRTDLALDQGEAAKELLSSISAELEHLRSTVANSMVRSRNSDGEGGDNDDDNDSAKPRAANTEEILEALHKAVDELRDHVTASSTTVTMDDDMLGALRGEFELLRSNLARTSSRADTEEVLETVRLGLDDLRSHLEKKLDQHSNGNPEAHMQVAGEVIDALNEGLENLKGDLAKAVDSKPLDMTVSYEILETLKLGIAEVRNDVEALREAGHVSKAAATAAGYEVVLAEGPDGVLTREISGDADASIPIPAVLKRDDLEKVEVLLAQLQIKVEAMDANIQNPPAQPPPPTVNVEVPHEPAPGTALKADLEGIETMLKELQVGVALIAAKEIAETTATKEDTDAIETLLRNTKARLDEIVLPDPESAVTREQLDNLEAVVRVTNEGLASLSADIAAKPAQKSDVEALDAVVRELKVVLEEVKTTVEKPAEESEDLVKKPDLDVVGVVCMEIKTKIEELKIADPETQPSKADIEQLTGLIHDFRESHDKLKDSYETDIAVTAKAFDDRKQEAGELSEAIGAVKVFLEDVKEEIKSQIGEGNSNVGTLTDIVKNLDETIGSNFSVTADVKELVDTVNREFERMTGEFEGVKKDAEEKHTVATDQSVEHKNMVITEIHTRLDDKFDALMSKYDDAQNAADEQKAAMEEKVAEQKEMLESSKAMAEELKITIDTLGTAVTSLQTDFTDATTKFTEATDKVSNDAHTVFSRIDETHVKLDDHHIDGKAEHLLTRDEVAKILPAVEALQADVSEYHPTFMVTLKEVLALVQQHYEHGQKSHEAAEEHARNLSEETKTHKEELKEAFSGLPALMPAPTAIEPAVIESQKEYDDTVMHEKLDQLLGSSQEKYDDTVVREKLDQLVGHAVDAAASQEQLERLDKIHEQVVATAAEVSQFVTAQTRLITEGEESKAREAEEMAVILERRTMQKEQVEREIVGLVEEKDDLAAVVAELKAERDALMKEKSRVGQELSSLHTALEIRCEELHAMDSKADKLERRILEGLMDHSRVLLQRQSARQNRGKPASPKKDRPVQRDRGISNASEDTVSSLPPPSSVLNGLNMALKQRPALRRGGGGPNYNPNTARRIMSLNQISSNVPNGNAGFAISPKTSLANVKRSQSVRKPDATRKVSWQPVEPKSRTVSEQLLLHGVDEDKENGRTIEKCEEGAEPEDAAKEEILSDAGTERRASYISDRTSLSALTPTTESAMTYGTGSSYDDDESVTDGAERSEMDESERRSSYGTVTGDSDLTYGTGSYMTGSETDRRTSFGSTVRSNLGIDSSIAEGSNEDSEEEEENDVDEESMVSASEAGMHPGFTSTGAAPVDIQKALQHEDGVDAEAGAERFEPSDEQLAIEAAAAGPDRKNMAVFAMPSDSGLGSDLPTAAGMSGSEADYFRKSAEEESAL